jgi:V8-like Glu-specific endopeptidase
LSSNSNCNSSSFKFNSYNNNWGRNPNGNNPPAGGVHQMIGKMSKRFAAVCGYVSGVYLACVMVQADGAVAQQPKAAAQLTPSEAIKAIAAQSGAKPGTPAYTSALRDAYDKVLGQLETGDADRYDKTRSITVPAKTKERTRGLGAPTVPAAPQLEINSNPDYQKWLNDAVETPVIEVITDSGAKERVRSLGSDKITNSKLFPEVSLTVQGVSQGYCSGVLIDRQTILTAGHCACDYKTGHTVVFGANIQANNRYQEEIQSIKRDPGINCSNMMQSIRGRDIAVIRLRRAIPAAIVPQTASVAPPELIFNEFGRNNRRLWIVGFGYTETTSTNFKNLSLVPMLTPDCTGNFGGLSGEARFGCVAKREIVAKDPRKVGPCPGDSGGGAFLMVNETVNGRTFQKPWLVGLVSRATADSRVTCGDGAVFTLLTEDAMKWARSAAAELAAAP